MSIYKVFFDFVNAATFFVVFILFLNTTIKNVAHIFMAKQNKFEEKTTKKFQKEIL